MLKRVRGLSGNQRFSDSRAQRKPPCFGNRAVSKNLTNLFRNDRGQAVEFLPGQ